MRRRGSVRLRREGDAAGGGEEDGGGKAAHGDEATKSIILLNNKPCYVRFAKITKTTPPVQFVYAAVYAYIRVGSFIRVRPFPIHPFARARNYRANRPRQCDFSASIQMRPDLIYSRYHRCYILIIRVICGYLQDLYASSFVGNQWRNNCGKSINLPILISSHGNCLSRIHILLAHFQYICTSDRMHILYEIIR